MKYSHEQKFDPFMNKYLQLKVSKFCSFKYLKILLKYKNIKALSNIYANTIFSPQSSSRSVKHQENILLARTPLDLSNFDARSVCCCLHTESPSTRLCYSPCKQWNVTIHNERSRRHNVENADMMRKTSNKNL